MQMESLCTAALSYTVDLFSEEFLVTIKKENGGKKA